MRFLIPVIICLGFLASNAQADTDPVQECRQAHADDPTAHISCLEAALTALKDATSSAAPANEASSVVLGAEQVQQKQRASGEVVDQPLSVRIVSTRYTSQGLGVFMFENDQIWRETEAMPQHLRLEPDQAYTATLERGKVGGYRMQVEGIRRMLKVERLK
jgi:hypothetical protein